MKNAVSLKGSKGSLTRILAIDDEPDILTNYQRLLRRAGHDCVVTTNPEDVERLVAEFQPHLVLTDLIMPKVSGLDVLREVRRIDPTIPVILVTAHGTIENAVEAMKNHAANYLTKPFSVDDLLGKIQETLSDRLIADAPAAGSGETEGGEWRLGIIGVSAVMNNVLELVRKVARTDVNVLIVGDSGTGKEVIARAIHRLSARRGEIFVPVDCASLPENLLESELFGYCKGAFTGAAANKMGLFEFAHKGTLFLDEIGELPINLQSKLLRVLQERQFRPIGGRDEVEIDVRVIAATNRDLEQACRDKSFRSDLYYRLNVVTIRLPRLCERREDVPLMADAFLREFRQNNATSVEGITPEAMAALKGYDWPGNVRELQNVIERAATLTTESMIQLGDLPDGVHSAAGVVSMEPALDPGGKAIEAQGGVSGKLFDMENRLVKDFERDYLVSLLVEHRFNISRAAEAAGCHRRTLYRMIERQGLDLGLLRKQQEQ